MYIYLSTWPNYLTDQETHQLAVPLAELAKVKKQNTESTTSVTMTQTVSPHESCYLFNCRLLDVNVHCCLVFVRSVRGAIVCACS